MTISMPLWGIETADHHAGAVRRPGRALEAKVTGRGSVGADSVRTALALRQLIDETRRFFHRLKAAAESLHEADDLNAGERAVLAELADQGPRAVPEMARARPVSRQHVQVIVNRLRKRGLVEAVENPRHLRSKNLRLTAAGRAAVARFRGREGRVVAALVPELGAAELEAATRALVRVGALLADAPGRLAGVVS